MIAQFLLDENLVNGTVDSVLATGAHALFFPHGVGHHLGLDVHDMENFGDLPSYPKGTNRSEQFGTCYLRMDLPLQKDWIVTIEPGFYIIPAMLDSSNFRKTFAGVVNFDKAEQ